MIKLEIYITEDSTMEGGVHVKGKGFSDMPIINPIEDEAVQKIMNALPSILGLADWGYHRRHPVPVPCDANGNIISE